MKISSFTLDNQLKVIYAKDNSNPLICIQLYVRTGSAWEAENESGLSHFTEHMVFKSTEKFPDNLLSERISFLGGNVNAYTEYDSTCFYITIPSDFFSEGLEIIAQLARKVNFKQPDFSAEQSVIIEECKQFQNDPEDFFLEYIAADYFKFNPYKKPIIGNLKTLRQYKIEDVRNFYEKYYIPNNCFLVITGDINQKNLKTEIIAQFSDWKKKNLVKKVPVINDFRKETTFKSLKKNINSDIIAFVLPDLSDSNPDSYPLSLVTKAFAIGKRSRLYKRLFHKEKMVDSIRVHSLSGINDGISIILVNPKKKTALEKIVEIFRQELSVFYKFSLNDIEINDCKRDLIFYYKYTYEYNESLASSLGSEELISGYENFLSYPDKINNLENTEIKKVIDEYYKPDFLQIYHIGKAAVDKKSIDRIIQKKTSVLKVSSNKSDVFIDSLPNGMKIILKKVTGKPTLGISLTSEVSQLNEDLHQLGLNLLTSALLLYGNEKRNYEQLLNYSNENGIQIGISPKSETTSININCFKERLNIALELLSDVILTPTFPRNHLENLKQTNLSNFNRIKDYPQYYASRLWKEMIFNKKSNLISSFGTNETVRKFTQKKVSEWYKRYYNYTDMTLSIVGDFDLELILNTCRALFPPADKLNGRREQIPIYQPGASRYKKHRRGLNQCYINIGGFGCNALEIEKNTAFHVLAQMIGGDMNSLLFTEIREKLGLAYSVEFEFRSFRSLGYFLITAIVDKKKEKQAVESIISVLDNIKMNGISAYELTKTKNFIRGQRLMDEESMLSRAQTLSVLQTLGFSYDYYLQRNERLENVSIDQIHQIAAEYFDPENYFIHTLT